MIAVPAKVEYLLKTESSRSISKCSMTDIRESRIRLRNGRLGRIGVAEYVVDVVAVTTTRVVSVPFRPAGAKLA